MRRHNYIARRGMVNGTLTTACVERLRELLARKAGGREAVSYIRAGAA